MRITTRQDLKNYILGMLGQGIIEIELTDFQMDENIDFTIRKFSEYAMYGSIKDVLLVDVPKDTREIKLDRKISEISNVRTQSAGGGFMGLNVPGGLVVTPSEIQAMIFGSGSSMAESVMLNVTSVLSQVSMYDTLFTVIPAHTFNPYSHILKFFEPIASPKVLLDVRYYYEPQEVDDIYDQVWVKEYAMTLCKRNWGQNIGKYDAALIGGTRLNYERIIQEANTDLERLHNELLEQYAAPLPIIRG